VGCRVPEAEEWAVESTPIWKEGGGGLQTSGSCTDVKPRGMCAGCSSRIFYCCRCNGTMALPRTSSRCSSEAYGRWGMLKSKGMSVSAKSEFSRTWSIGRAVYIHVNNLYEHALGAETEHGA